MYSYNQVLVQNRKILPRIKILYFIIKKISNNNFNNKNVPIEIDDSVIIIRNKTNVAHSENCGLVLTVSKLRINCEIWILKNLKYSIYSKAYCITFNGFLSNLHINFTFHLYLNYIKYLTIQINLTVINIFSATHLTENKFDFEFKLNQKYKTWRYIM